MKRKLFSIAVAAMMLFSFALSVTAADGAEHGEIGCCAEHTGEVVINEDGGQYQIIEPNHTHSFGMVHTVYYCDIHCTCNRIYQFRACTCGEIDVVFDFHGNYTSHNWIIIPGGAPNAGRLYCLTCKIFGN